MAPPQQSRQQPQPDQGLQHPVLDGAVAAALAAGGATIAGLAPAAAAAVAPAGLALTAAGVAKLTQEMVENVVQHNRGRVRTRAKDLREFLAEQYPERPQRAIDDAVTGEVAKEREFTRRMRARLERDLPKALQLADADERRAKVMQILEREQRYLELRELAMNDRSIAYLERLSVKEQSPKGAFWKLSPFVREHTPDCIAMGEKFWPWSVLNELNPPTHHGCRCQLLTLDEAVERDYMDPEHANVVDWAAFKKAKELLKEAAAIAEAVSLEEFRDYLAELEEAADIAGAMIAFYPSEKTREKLAAFEHSDQDAEAIHLTLVYLGPKADELDDKHDAIRAAVARAAAASKPLRGKIAGIGMFSAHPKTEQPLIATADVVGLTEFRTRLIDELGDLLPPQQHGFTPHITLAYVKGKRPPMDLPDQLPLTFDKVWLVWADKREAFELGKSSKSLRASAKLEELYIESLHPRDPLGKWTAKLGKASQALTAQAVDAKMAFGPGDASPEHPLRAEYRARAAAAILESHTEIENAVLLLPREHERRAELLKKLVKGDVPRAVKEYALTPVGDLEILGGVEVSTHPVHGQANANLVTRRLQMGSTSNIGDFRHELGHALRAAMSGRGGPSAHTALTAYVSKEHSAALARVQASIKAHNPKPKTEPEWEEKIGVPDPRALDNWEEDFAEQYRIYHRALYQATQKEATAPYAFDPQALARYRKLHPGWARLWDAWYTAQLLGRGHDDPNALVGRTMGRDSGFHDAFHDIVGSAVYRDSAGNYRYKKGNKPGGPVTPWSDAVREAFPNHLDFVKAANDYIRPITLPLQEAHIVRRFPKGTVEGGQFMPRRGGVTHPVSRMKRRLLRELVPELPRTPKQRRHIHREVTIDGRTVRVPEQRAFDRTFGRHRYTSPSATTEILRNGKPFVPRSVEGQRVPPLQLPSVRPPESAARRDEERIAAAARVARQASTAGARGAPPAEFGADGWATDNGLRDAGFMETSFTDTPAGLRFSYVGPDGVSTLDVVYSRDGAQVADIDWRPRPAPVVGPQLDRPPKTWSEFTSDITAWAHKTALDHGHHALIGDIRSSDAQTDHAGEHFWDGHVELGPDVQADITTAAVVHGRGGKLSEAQKQRVWMSYHAAVHEALHAANPMGQDEWDEVAMALEEGLTEELAHLEAVKKLRRQGQDDVVQWVADHPTHPAVLGTYLSYRHALDTILDKARVAPELREDTLDRLKWARPRDRVDMLARAVAQGSTEISPARADGWVRSQIMGVGKPSYADLAPDWQFVPIAVPNIDPSSEPAVAHEIAGVELHVGDKVHVKRRVRDMDTGWKTVPTDGTVYGVRDVDGGWVFDVGYDGQRGVDYSLLPSQIVTVEPAGTRGGAVSFGVPSHELRITDSVVRPGDVVGYDGRTDGGTSEARVVRIVRAVNPQREHDQSWVIEAVTTGNSLAPGRRVLLTPERVGGKLDLVAERPDGGGTGQRRGVTPFTLERKARLDKHFAMPAGTSVVPLRYVVSPEHPRPSRIRDELMRLADPAGGGRRLAPAARALDDGRVALTEDPALPYAAGKVGLTHLPVRVQRRNWLADVEHDLESFRGHTAHDQSGYAIARVQGTEKAIEIARRGGGQDEILAFAREYGPLHGGSEENEGYQDALRNAWLRAEQATSGVHVGQYAQRKNPWDKGWVFTGKLWGHDDEPKPTGPIEVDPKKLMGGEIVKDAQGKTWRTALTGTKKEPTVTLTDLEGEAVIYPESDMPSLTLVKGSTGYQPPPPPKPVWDDSHTVQVKGWAGGSNGARVAETAAGERWLVKAYRGDQDRVATELLANAVYRKLGIAVPEAGTLTFDGKPALAYPWLEGEIRQWKEPNDQLAEGFMADALLANWDVVGLSKDNVLWQGDTPVRLDQGGTLQFRAQGQKKPFGPVPTEVWTMASPKGGQAFSTMDITDAGKRRGATRIARLLKPQAVDELVDAAPFADDKMREEVRDALKARVAWMGDYAAGRASEPKPLEGAEAGAALQQGQSTLQLFPEQDVAVQAFSQGWDAVVNDHLRTGAPKESAKKEVRFLVRELDSLFSHVRTTTDVIAYAAVTHPGTDNAIVGRALRDRGFLGLSLEPGPAQETAEKIGGSVARIVIPEGSRLLFMPGLSPGLPAQPELLLERDSRLRILRSNPERTELETVLADRAGSWLSSAKKLSESDESALQEAAVFAPAPTQTAQRPAIVAPAPRQTAAWSPQLHPRAQAGSPAGGEFTRKTQGQQQVPPAPTDIPIPPRPMTRREKRLSRMASKIAGKPVRVIARDDHQFMSMAFINGSVIVLGGQAAAEAANGEGVGLVTLLHEISHTRGIDHVPDNCAPDKWAMSQLKKTLRTYWPRLNAKQRQSRYDDARGWLQSSICAQEFGGKPQP